MLTILESLALTDRTDFFVTAVTVTGLSDTLPSTVLRYGAVALAHAIFDSSATCY